MPLRVVIQQPALAAYRVPVFRELARRPGIELLVTYASDPNLPNAPPDGFRAEPIIQRKLRLGPRSAMVDPAQWRFATRAAADVLILTWNVQYATLVPSLLRARASGVRTILWGHGYSKHEAAWRRWPRERVAGLADALLFYNHTTADRFAAAGWPRERLFVALNALDQEPIQAARNDWLARPADLAAFRTQHGLDRGPVVLFVSRLDPANRLDLLVEAAAALRPRHPHLRVIVIGKGDAEQARLTALAARLGVTDCVRFLGAIYGEPALAPWFLSADVFCYPANIGLSILHAFGYGLPVVTSDELASQNPEIEALRHGENGLVYTHNDAAALADALDALLKDRPRLDRLAAAAHATATERFTLANMVSGFGDAIQRVSRSTEQID